MTWAEITDELAERFYLSRAKTKRLLDVLTQSVAASVLADGRLVVPGFGVFARRTRRARRVRNPQTRELMQLPETMEVRFRKSKHFGGKRR